MDIKGISFPKIERDIFRYACSCSEDPQLQVKVELTFPNGKQCMMKRCLECGSTVIRNQMKSFWYSELLHLHVVEIDYSFFSFGEEHSLLYLKDELKKPIVLYDCPEKLCRCGEKGSHFRVRVFRDNRSFSGEMFQCEHCGEVTLRMDHFDSILFGLLAKHFEIMRDELMDAGVIEKED